MHTLRCAVHRDEVLLFFIFVRAGKYMYMQGHDEDEACGERGLAVLFRLE